MRMQEIHVPVHTVYELHSTRGVHVQYFPYDVWEKQFCLQCWQMIWKCLENRRPTMIRCKTYYDNAKGRRIRLATMAGVSS